MKAGGRPGRSDGRSRCPGGPAARAVRPADRHGPAPECAGLGTRKGGARWIPGPASFSSDRYRAGGRGDVIGAAASAWGEAVLE
ncbi:hypothetical protein GCM10022207_14700 [Streptomyces lannensis]|uniref:Uncharacterized protein n=1 Tax=Streptomyces lannensis TaxID=766498 RepID=A0ABP7JSJ8_9ACTN